MKQIFEAWYSCSLLYFKQFTPKHGALCKRSLPEPEPLGDLLKKDPISTATLYDLIDLARLGGSARNGQPWQYMIANSPVLCDKIFPYLGWAGYLTDWKGPIEGERPSAYILCLLNKNRLKGPESEAQFDLGIATQKHASRSHGKKNRWLPDWCL